MLMPVRDPKSGKGENGKIGIIGGSVDYTGAPSLTARAAYRAGCDMAKILAPNNIKSTVQGFSENLIVEGYDGDYLNENILEKAKQLEKWADVLVIGPGLSSPSENIVREILDSKESPAIVDAEAIRIAIKNNIQHTIYTPNRNELKHFDQVGGVESFVNESEGVVVLEKGPNDVVHFQSSSRKVSGGHPGMTVGGTGDVLTGVVASLLSQGLDKVEASEKAAKALSSAGESIAEEYGNGILATDLIEEVAHHI